MTDQETLQIIEDSRRIVRELDTWADEKISSGVPAAQEELEILQAVRAKLAELKLALKDLPTGSSDSPPRS
jgi:hypothetical protein